MSFTCEGGSLSQNLSDASRWSGLIECEKTVEDLERLCFKGVRRANGLGGVSEGEE